MTIRKLGFLLVCLSSLALAGVVMAQSMGRLPGVVYPSDRGARNSSTISNVLMLVGSQDALFILDKGPWTITTNVQFPANVSVQLLQGAYFNIHTNVVLSILGNFDAGKDVAFSGAGSASGPALFPYRLPEWGSTSQYDIGRGYLEDYVTNAIDLLATDSFSTNNSYQYASGTTQDVDSLVVRSTNAVFAAGSIDWAELNTNSFDWAAAAALMSQNLNASNTFGGLARFPLTTNMISQETSGGTALPFSSAEMYKVCDSIFTNGATGAYVTTLNDGVRVNIDLGQYIAGGWWIVIMSTTNVTGGAGDEPTIRYGYVWHRDTFSTLASTLVLNAGQQSTRAPGTNSVSGYVRIQPFTGRYLAIDIVAGGTGEADVRINEIMVYASTNSFNTFQGRVEDIGNAF
jgi:hypothetical protein